MIHENNDETVLPPYYKHWCGETESYCGGDALLTLLNKGWTLEPIVYLETQWFKARRYTTLYHCRLQKAGEYLYIVVTSNPFVRRLLREQKCQFIHYKSMISEKVSP